MVGVNRLQFYIVVNVYLIITIESTHNNEQNEVDPVPEGMSVLNVIHNVHPSLQADHLSHVINHH